MTLLLSNADVEKLLTMPDCIHALEAAYVELESGRGVTRTRSDTITPTLRDDALYSLKSMDGVAPALGVGAVPQARGEGGAADEKRGAPFFQTVRHVGGWWLLLASLVLEASWRPTTAIPALSCSFPRIQASRWL